MRPLKWVFVSGYAVLVAVALAVAIAVFIIASNADTRTCEDEFGDGPWTHPCTPADSDR